MSHLGGVYLAYPIDQRGPASLAGLFERVEHLKQMLCDTGTASWVFDPGDAFAIGKYAEPTDSVAAINRQAANRADAVVAFLPRGVPTVGVPMEIDRAYSQGKLVVILSDAGESWMLQYPPNASQGRIFRRDDWDIDDLMAVVEWLNEHEPYPEDRRYMDLKVVLEGGQMPTRAHADDAGLDLYTSEATTIWPGQFVDVPCGLSLELPYSTWGLVTGRSSALRRKGLLIHSGVIDVGYRGPIFAGAFNLTGDVVIVQAGERIAQLIILHNQTERVVPVQATRADLTPSARAEKGFGSSGA